MSPFYTNLFVVSLDRRIKISDNFESLGEAKSNSRCHNRTLVTLRTASFVRVNPSSSQLFTDRRNAVTDKAGFTLILLNHTAILLHLDSLPPKPAAISTIVWQAHTLVSECCKDDQWSQWEMPYFGVCQHQITWVDFQKNLQGWPCRGPHPTCNYWGQSVQRGRDCACVKLSPSGVRFR